MQTRELLTIARTFREGALGRRSIADMCMAVNAPLASLLSSVYDVPCKIEELWFDETPQGTTNHIIIRLADGRILDATADQFGLAPVYVGPMPPEYDAWQRAYDGSA